METREAITLDARAQRRLLVLNHVRAGELSGEEAAGMLRVSVRTIRRLLARYRGPEGAAALVHGNVGQVPSNRIDDAIRGRLVELATSRYGDVNRAHLADLLAEREGLRSPSEASAGSSPRPAWPRSGGADRGAIGSAGNG